MSRTQRVFLGLLALCIIGVVTVPSASAIDPKYAKYAGCPDKPEVFACIRSETTGGHIQIGNTDTPINKTLTLSGGIVNNGPVDNDIVYTSQGGLTGDPLEVPGGLTGLTGLSEFIINLITFGANKVYAQAVLVGTPNLGEQFSLKLPIKVKLINPFLKSGCSIGSTSNPINLDLITGTTAPPPPNKPITGRPPSGLSPDPNDPNITKVLDIKHVNNSFSAPKASGCDLIGFGLINALVNLRTGLPAAAGTNEAVLDHTNIDLVDPAAVYP